MGGDTYSVKILSPVLSICTKCTDCALGNITASNLDTCARGRSNFHASVCTVCPGLDAVILDLSKQQDCLAQSLFNYSEKCNPGTYLSVSILTIAGQYIGTVAYNATPLRKSPFSVSVVPAAPYPLLSTLSPIQEYTATSGAAHPFFISSSDIYGNLVNSAAVGNSFRLDAYFMPTARSVGSSASDPLPDQNGVFTVKFSFTISGEYSIVIVILPFDQPIRGSPFDIAVKAGEVNASNSNILGNGISIATAGIPQSFRIIARDNYMNLKTDRVLNSSGDLLSTLISLERNISFIFNVSDTLDGTLLGMYLATVSATYSLIVSLKSQNFLGIPTNVTVKPGSISAEHVQVAGQGLYSASVNSRATFEILAFDRFSNKRIVGGDFFYVTLAGGWTKLVDGEQRNPENISATYLDNSDGSYSASYVLTRSGIFSIHIFLVKMNSTISVKKSPFTNLTVVPAETSGPSCVIYGITNSSSTEDPKRVLILAKDIFGNPAKPPAIVSLRFGAIIEFNETINKNPFISYREDGIFSIGFPG